MVQTFSGLPLLVSVVTSIHSAAPV